MANKTLPAITLTDAQYARVVKVIPGKTAAEKVAAYEQMVRDMLRDLVIEADLPDAEEAKALLDEQLREVEPLAENRPVAKG